MPIRPRDSDPVELVDFEAAMAYINGDALGCARILARLMPRMELGKFLLLFASLSDLKVDELLGQLAPVVLERSVALRDEDPERAASLEIVLGLRLPDPDLASYREKGAARLAFWASRRLARAGQADAAEALARFASEYRERSLEGFIATGLLRTGTAGADTEAATEVDRALLAATILQRMGRGDLMGPVVEVLITSGRPDAVLAGIVTQATLLYEQRRDGEALATLVTCRDLVAQGDVDGVHQAALLLLAGDLPASAETLGLIDDVLTRIAGLLDQRGRASTAAAFAQAIKHPSAAAYRDRVIAFIIEIDALSAAAGGDLRAIADGLAASDGKDAYEYLDDASSRNPELERLAGLPAALLASAKAALNHPDSTARLRRAAARAIRNGMVADRPSSHVSSLAAALRAAGGAREAAELCSAAIDGHGFRIEDEENLTVVSEAVTAFLEAGTTSDAQNLLTSCLQHTAVELEEHNDIHDALSTALTRLSYATGEIEAVVPELYTSRYRRERVASKGADGIVDNLNRLGQTYELLGCLGSAQRYYWEVLLRTDLRRADEALRRRTEQRLAVVRHRAARAPDADYAAFVDSILPAGDSEGGSAVAESHGGQDIRRRSARAARPIDALARLAEERVRLQLGDDAAGALRTAEQSLEYIEAGRLRGGYLNISIAQTLALGLAAQGSFERATDLLLRTASQIIEHVAGLAAAAPVEDLREISTNAARCGEIVLSLAGTVDDVRAQACLHAFLRLRSLWGDLRMLRREAGGDAASTRRAVIAAARRRAARLVLDGPERERLDDFYTALLDARRQRDLDEIAGIWHRCTGPGLAAQLETAFSSSMSALGDHSSFIGYYRFHRPVLAPLPLTSAVIPEAAESYVAVVARRGELVSVPLGDAEEIAALVRALPAALRNEALLPRQRPLPPVSQRLARVLVDPVLKHLAGADRVHVTADGKLAEAPWPVLFELRGLERQTVRNVQSFAQIARPRAASVRLRSDAVVVGRPDYGRPPKGIYDGGIDGFNDLAIADIEASVVAGTCGSQAVVGREAVAGTVLDSSAGGVLHIASHGFTLGVDTRDTENYESVSDDLGAEFFAAREDLVPGPLSAVRLRDPMLHSGIAMTDVNDWLGADGRGVAETGIITAEDLSWCDLAGVDCVVLSACSSGAGTGSRALGSRGMRFAALAAGADWTIASLWPVPDVPTAVLMELLYERFEEGLSPPEALAAAQDRLCALDRDALLATATARAVLARSGGLARRYLSAVVEVAAGGPGPFEHPYYWGGFICSG